MSIMGDMKAIKALADEIVGKRTQDSDTRKYMPYGFCDDCGTPLEYEAPFHGAADQPPSTGGYWCPECQRWQP